MTVSVCEYIQEQLLLSVLPVHVAVEMKNKMLHRLRISTSTTNSSTSNSRETQTGMQQLNRQKSAYGRFYDMYVKVHENVR